MKLKHLGFVAGLLVAFAAGTKAGFKYATDHYVTKDKKFIEGKVVDDTK